MYTEDDMIASKGMAFMEGQKKGYEHAKPSEETKRMIKDVSTHVRAVEGKLDHHLEVYANNGKELAGLKVAVEKGHETIVDMISENRHIYVTKEGFEKTKTNLDWLMKFFWIFMTPIVSALIYLMLKINV